MEAEDFKVGDKVTVEDGGQELHGVVESVQLKAELVDVKIYEPGHRSHCLIKAYPADAVSMDEKKRNERAKGKSA